MKNNTNKFRDNSIVYQTSNLSSFNDDKEEQSLDTDNQNICLGIRLEKKNRGGKLVTLIQGHPGNIESLQSLSKQLKTHCGVGGSVSETDLILQGDQLSKATSFLISKGFKVKKTGG
jgi:translation initiation factor 1